MKNYAKLALLGLFLSTSHCALVPAKVWDTAQNLDDQYIAARSQFIRNAGRIRGDGGSQSGPGGEPGYLVSCCGEADAYEADQYEIAPDGEFYAVLTCNEPKNCETIMGKKVRPPGQKYRIPPDKFLIPGAPLNNTGHGWVFLNPTTNEVYCYSLATGI